MRRALGVVSLLVLLAASSALSLAQPTETSSPNFVVAGALWGSQSSPLVASPGNSNLPLEVILVNEGGISLDTNATIYLKEPFYYSYYQNGHHYQSEQETVALGTATTGTELTAVFYVSIRPTAQDGVYVLPIQVQAKGFNQTLSIRVPISGYASVSAAQVVFDPPYVFPGQSDVELEAYLVNDGTSVAQNASAKLVLPNGFSPSWGNSTLHEIGIIPVGEPVQVPFFFNVGDVKSPANYTAFLNVTWTGGHRLIPVSVMVEGKAGFSITAVEGENLTQGGSGQKLYVTVENDGNYTAQDVQFNLIVPNEFSGVTTDYSGSLKPGQQDMARFSIDTAGSAKATTYNLTLEVTWYQNNTETPFISYLPLQVHVKQSLINSLESDLTSGKGAGSTLLLVLLLIIIFLVGLLIGVLSRRGGSQEEREKKR